MDYSINQAKASDTDILTIIGRETFYETFAHFNSEENMRLFLDENFNIKDIRKSLEDKSTTQYLACVGKEYAGYMKLRRGKMEGTDDKEIALEICRLYVRQKFQKQKLGKVLMEEALALAKRENINTVWLGVWEHNPDAIRFYEKFGFEIYGSHEFLLGKDRQKDWLMKKEIEVGK